jgi:glycerol-3-phosphate dehydrogenase
MAQATGFDRRQIEAMWSLCGNRMGPALNKMHGQTTNLAGTNLPLRFVGWLIRREWVQRLDDLVERRLMLHFEPALSLQTLRELADLLVAERRLQPADVDRTVTATVARLREHFGRNLAEK